jgi:hypothetical protein
MTAQQLFLAACRRAERRASDDGVPLTRLLNRLDVAETDQIVSALAEQFRLFMRDALDRTDPDAKPVPLGERVRRQLQMKQFPKSETDQ